MPTLLGYRRRPFWLLLGLAAALLSSGELFAQPPEDAETADRDVIHIDSPRSRVQIIEKFSRVLELKNKIIRVDGFDPAVLNITALSAYQVRMQALTPGVTSVVLFDENDQSYKVEVFVNGDARHLQAYIDQQFPNANVEAIKVKDSVILKGWVTQPEHINSMVEIAEQFFPKVLNQIQVGGVQQVLLKVKVMEIQRGKIRRLGINWVGFSGENVITSTPGDLVRVNGLTNNPASAAVTAASLGNPTAILGLSNDHATLNVFLDALKQEALLDILAEPQIVVMNGRPANLLSGGQFPILVPQSLGTVTIQWKEFGTQLEAVPLILGQGKLRLELHPEVSERDFTNSVQVNGLTVPGLTTRRVNTQVEMKFGQTLMIAGLIANRRTTETNKVPFLGELPIIGAAFRRLRDNDAETELVIMVTPELVAPLDPSQVPPGGPGEFTDVPTDRELYIDGLLEVPKYGDECVNCEEDGTDIVHPIYSNDPAGMMTPTPAASGTMTTIPGSNSGAKESGNKPDAAGPQNELPPTPVDTTGRTRKKNSAVSGTRRPGMIVPASGVSDAQAPESSAVQHAEGTRVTPEQLNSRIRELDQQRKDQQSQQQINSSNARNQPPANAAPKQATKKADGSKSAPKKKGFGSYLNPGFSRPKFLSSEKNK